MDGSTEYVPINQSINISGSGSSKWQFCLCGFPDWMLDWAKDDPDFGHHRSLGL